MNQVLVSNPLSLAGPILLADCHHADLYFMRYEGRIYFLDREHMPGGCDHWVFHWRHSPGVVLGGPITGDIARALEYGLSIGGKIYRFENWDHVLPNLP